MSRLDAPQPDYGAVSPFSPLDESDQRRAQALREAEAAEAEAKKLKAQLAAIQAQIELQKATGQLKQMGGVPAGSSAPISTAASVSLPPAMPGNGVPSGAPVATAPMILTGNPPSAPPTPAAVPTVILRLLWIRGDAGIVSVNGSPTELRRNSVLPDGRRVVKVTSNSLVLSDNSTFQLLP
jgi:hypothetical protein